MSDATATAEKSRYETKIEDAGPARKRLTVTVPADVIGEKIEDQMGTLMSQAQLPGFRKGRAPRALLERRFGETVRGETKSQVIADAYSTVLEEHGVRPVGEPEAVTPFDDLEMQEGKALTFAVEVEVVPEFTLPELEGIEVKKPTLDVTEEHVATELDRQQRRFGKLIEVDGSSEAGDRMLGPGSATKEGDDEPFFTHDAVDIVIPENDEGGRGQVLGLAIDGLHDMLVGKNAGDELVIETVGPDGHELEHIRGKKLTINYTVRTVQRVEPAPVADVCAAYGIESEEILREQIRTALEERRDQEQRSAMRDQVCRHLVKSVEMDLPEKLSAAQATRNLERYRYELMQRGAFTDDEIEARLAEVRADSEDQARRRLKLDFILHRLAENFEVQVSEQEVNGRVAQLAVQRGVRPEQFRAELARTGALNQIAAQIREQKAADRVIDQAKVVEISAEDWRKELEAERGDAGKAGAASAGSASKASGTKKKTSKKKTTKKSS